jgi:hypothetical protein
VIALDSDELQKSIKGNDCPGCKPLEQVPQDTPVTEPAEEEVTTTPEEPAAEKAAETITEVVDDIAARQKKYEMFRPVEQTFWAFYEVYFDSATPAEDYETLLAEFISILSGETEKGRLTDKSIDLKAIGVDFLIEKAGRVLSRANREKVEAAVAALNDVLDADMPAEEAAKTLDISVGAINITGFKKSMKLRNRDINKAVRALLNEKGGPGSGNHGHSGRPGQRGGSSPSGGSSAGRAVTGAERDAILKSVYASAGQPTKYKQHFNGDEQGELDRLNKNYGDPKITQRRETNRSTGTTSKQPVHTWVYETGSKKEKKYNVEAVYLSKYTSPKSDMGSSVHVTYIVPASEHAPSKN